MRDIEDDHTLFAVEKQQHEHFADVLSSYRGEPDEIPSDYTLEVLKLTEVRDDVYTLNDTKPLRYPMNHLHYVFAFPAESMTL
jgi:hypothetical protein